jgi:hypothetical protein
MKKVICMVLLVLALPLGAVNAKEQPECKSLETIFKTGVKEEIGVCKVEVQRSGLEVIHMGKKLSPQMMELALMANFEKLDNHTAVMGEFALLEEEVNPVIDALRQGGVDISALHNHMIGESPRILYVHFQGMGDMMQLAQTVKNAMDKTVRK